MRTTFVIGAAAVLAAGTAPAQEAFPASLSADLGADRHFEIEATFEPPSEAGALPAVAVRFVPLDPDVEVNEIPAPRLQLDGSQTLLAPGPKAPRSPEPPMSADAPRYLDLSEPVRFPVRLAADAPEGIHGVDAEVVYFYCSKSEGWCRRGTEPVTIPLLVSR